MRKSIFILGLLLSSVTSNAQNGTKAVAPAQAQPKEVDKNTVIEDQGVITISAPALQVSAMDSVIQSFPGYHTTTTVTVDPNEGSGKRKSQQNISVKGTQNKNQAIDKKQNTREESQKGERK